MENAVEVDTGEALRRGPEAYRIIMKFCYCANDCYRYYFCHQRVLGIRLG